MSRKFADKIPRHDRLIIQKIQKIEADVFNNREANFSHHLKTKEISESIVSTQWLA